MSILKTLKRIGPGAIVAAAFIGPGTVTTATKAGAAHGFVLLWAILFSTVATIILQEMSGRLGVAAQQGLGEALITKVSQPVFRYILIGLVLTAIVIGNGAYEAGNLTGAALGFTHIEGIGHWPIIFIAGCAAVLLFTGSYRVIEKALIGLVCTLGLVFLISAIAVSPPILEVLKGLFTPKIPANSLMIVVGLIGTTVVPYNLFLHASISKRKWDQDENISDQRMDTILSIGLGGLITMCIMISAAMSLHGTDIEVTGMSSLSVGLQSLLGDYAIYFMTLGFLAAGLSSAITAPLASAYAASELLKWGDCSRSWRFRLVWGGILILGLLLSLLGIRPTELILLAQFTNGLLLPIIAIILIWIVNDKVIMKEHTNSRLQNGLGIVVIGITIMLGAKSIMSVMGWI